MTWLALLLLGVGAADVVASLWPEPRVPDAWRRWVAPAAGGVLVVLVAALAGLSGPDWLAVAYLAIICGTLTTFMQSWGQARVESTRAAVIMCTEPVWAVVLALWFGFESLTPQVVIGGSLVVLALMLCVWPGTRARVIDTLVEELRRRRHRMR